MKKLGYLYSFQVSFLSYGSWIAKDSRVFGNFVLMAARNLSLLLQFMYVHLNIVFIREMAIGDSVTGEVYSVFFKDLFLLTSAEL